MCVEYRTVSAIMAGVNVERLTVNLLLFLSIKKHRLLYAGETLFEYAFWMLEQQVMPTIYYLVRHLVDILLKCE